MIEWEGEKIADLEKEIIRQAALKVGRPINRLAAALGISRACLYRKLFEYHIDVDHPEEVSRDGV
jgi:DNA-binding NtrC family response regulator